MDDKKRCARCSREIDMGSESIFSNKEGKFWCDMRCLGVRVPDFNVPQPHFEE